MNEATGEQCIFCSIVAGTTPADVVLDTEQTMFFRDIAPKAPVHVVGIIKKHIASMAQLTDAHQAVAGRLLIDAARVAADLGIVESGYRIISNVGAHAGQEVPHLHIHVIGGEALGPLRC